MLRSRLTLVLLFVACFSMAAYLQPQREHMMAASGQGGDVLALLLGDGRKMFANEFYAKADTYFHRGRYPSIFDDTPKEENHMTGETAHSGEAHGESGHAEGGHDEHGHDEHEHEVAEGPPPLDWLERFGRHFNPQGDMHLNSGQEREMLPWLRLSTELDPHKVETYAVTAYWLRDRLGKVDEAEQILRGGLRANPNNPELLKELGRLNFENRKDYDRARNVWLVALRRWHEVEGPKKDPDKPDIFLLEQILGGLALVEIKAGRTDEAIGYLKQMKEISPVPDEVQKRIDEVKSGAGSSGH